MKKITIFLILISFGCTDNSKNSSDKLNGFDRKLNAPINVEKVLFFENFDSLPATNQIRINKGTVTENGSYYINKDYVNQETGNLGAFATVLKSSLGRKANRAEIEIDIDKYVNNNLCNLKFDFFVPETYELDKENEGREVMIFQIHSQPDPGNTWTEYRQNIPFDRPSIALYFGKNNDMNYLALRYGLNGKNNTGFENFKWFLAGIKEINLGSWNTIKISTKFSNTNTGYIQAWLNNETFSAFNGKDNKVFGTNMHNNTLPYLKMGMYRYWADSHNHEFYYDNLIITSSINELLIEEEMKFLNQYPNINTHL